MRFFNKSTVKLRKEVKDDKFNYYIDYSKQKESENFKRKLLYRIIDSNLCMVVMNTKMFYKNPKDDYQSVLNDVIALLEGLDVTYKKILYKKSADDTIMGVKVKVEVSEKQRDFALGFITSYENLEKLMTLISKYNLYFCVADPQSSEGELIGRFEENYDDIENLNQYFNCCIFDNSAIGQITIFSQSEINEMVKSLISEFNG
jgi:hypothetical protein